MNIKNVCGQNVYTVCLGEPQFTICLEYMHIGQKTDFATFGLPWPWPWIILSCNTHWPLPTYLDFVHIGKLFVDGQTYISMDIETGFIRTTRRSRSKNIDEFWLNQMRWCQNVIC